MDSGPSIAHSATDPAPSGVHAVTDPLPSVASPVPATIPPSTALALPARGAESAPSTRRSQRNIVLCFDGTTNRFGPEAITNVIRLFELLNKSDERQVCYYQPGIGTFDEKIPVANQEPSKVSTLSKGLEAIFANNIRQHILGGYRFLMAHYRQGDRLYMFGFSRGAYTVLALCGMLQKVGLLSFGNDEQVLFAWEMYNGGQETHANEFRKIFAQEVTVHFLGLWDTVKAANFRLPKPKGGIICHVYHALALDERRGGFKPHHPEISAPTHVVERWFVGDHSDVGGRFTINGRTDAHLANQSFRWIVLAALCVSRHFELSLLFDPQTFESYRKLIVYDEHDELLMGLQGTQVGGSKNEEADIREPIHNCLEGLNHWNAAELWHLGSPRGKLRFLSDTQVLHRSVGLKIDIDPKYGNDERQLNERPRAKIDEYDMDERDLCCRCKISGSSHDALL